MRMLIALWLVGCTAKAPPAAPTPTPGLVSSTTDRHELAHAYALSDGGVLALTSAGNLVRYDASLRPILDAIGTPKIVAIARGHDRHYAAHQDGTLSELDLETLSTRPIAKTAARPSWLGVHDRELVVVTGLRIELHSLESQAIHTIEIPAGSAAMANRHPQHFTLAGDDLWFGLDAGEWGGAAGKVDLASGTTTMVPRIDPVYGIVVGSKVWAHGGLIHMGSRRGYIAELGAGTVTLRWSNSSRRSPKKDPPGLPVTAMMPHAGGFRVLVWNRLYDVDAQLATWTKRAQLTARESNGRPDAMGNYPATIAMFETTRGTLVLVTSRDGLFTLQDRTLVPAQ